MELNDIYVLLLLQLVYLNSRFVTPPIPHQQFFAHASACFEQQIGRDRFVKRDL